MAIPLWYFLVFQTLMFQVSNAFDKSKVTFYLYRSGLKNPIKLNSENLQASFNRDLETVMFIHGYASGHMKAPAQNIKNAYLSVGDTNVVLVDYGPYSFPYLFLLANYVKIGKTCADLINSLVDKGFVDIANITLIAHSFGAYIARDTASNVKGRLWIVKSEAFGNEHIDIEGEPTNI